MKADTFNQFCKQLKAGTELLLSLDHSQYGESLNGLFLHYTMAGEYPGLLNLITPDGPLTIQAEWIRHIDTISPQSPIEKQE